MRRLFGKNKNEKEQGETATKKRLLEEKKILLAHA
jgi:hypothetical protein